MRRAATGLLSQRVVGRQQLEVGGVVVWRKARHGAADVLGVKAGNVQRTTQKATRHWTEGHKSHPQLSAGLQHRNFRVARPQGILRLQSCDRMLRMRPAQSGGRHFGQANGANLARTHQIGQRPYALFDGHLFVPTVQVVQVDHIGLQASKCVFAGLTDRGRAAINHTYLGAIALVHALHAAFAGQNELVAVRLHHLAHQGLVSPKTIKCSSIKKRHTCVQRREQHTLALFARDGSAISVAQVHAAQANGADGEGAKLSCLHGSILKAFDDSRRSSIHT